MFVRAYLSSGLMILTYALMNVEILSYLLPHEAIAQNWLLASGDNYGLGLPKTASTGGGTRLRNPENPDRVLDDPKKSTIFESGGEVRVPVRRSAPISPRYRKNPLLLQRQLPLITLLTPEDGARTASPQPILYWYIHEQHQVSSDDHSSNRLNSDSSVNSKTASQDFIGVGKLRITTSEDLKDKEKEPVTIFETALKIHHGLSSFKLPIAASLQPSKTYRWQITMDDVGQDQQKQQITASGWIVYTPPNANLQKSLMRALTTRDRAKLYADAGYWFEAIDGYTRWLKISPNDLKARAARTAILKAGLTANENLDVDVLLKLVNAGVTKAQK